MKSLRLRRVSRPILALSACLTPLAGLVVLWFWYDSRHTIYCDQMYAITTAVEQNDLVTVSRILDQGWDPNEPDDPCGYAPPPLLITAADLGESDMVRLLLCRGARPDIRVCSNDTPLTMAASTKHELVTHESKMDVSYYEQRRGGKYSEIVQVLLEHGANVSAKDVLGETAMDYIKHATDPDSRRIKALLLKYGAKE